MREAGRVDAFSAVLALVAACSSFDSAPSVDAEGGGAPPEADASPGEDGAPTIGAGCDRSAPLSSIRRLDGVNSPDNEGFPRISADERVLYFHRASATGYVVLRASRPAVEAAFDAPVPVEGIPTDARHPFVTANELEILFVRGLEGDAYRLSLWHARRDAVDEPFGAVARHPADDRSYGRHSPFLSADGDELFFTQVVSTTTSSVYRASLSDGGVGVPTSLTTVNSRTHDSEPVLSPDLLSLYFYSERGASPGQGSIWVARRDTPASSFRTPEPIEELVVPGAYSMPGSVSVDGCRLYFFSSKDPATGTDLFVAERAPR